MSSTNPDQWLQHGSTTDPARFGAEIEQLPSSIAALSGSVQKLLMHTDCLALHGIETGSLGAISRATLPVHERLAGLAATGPIDFVEGRPPAGRAVGTCRDFALLLCSFLRTHRVPARVRCGFASYFGEGWWDHWVCQFWDAARGSWRLADAELDKVLCDACRIGFDPTDMPEGAFLPAGEAWLECRAGRLNPESFGHGDNRGLWFMSINVVRDSLSLSGQEMSVWDRWREARPQDRHLSGDDLLWVDALARDPERRPDALVPPWLVVPPTASAPT